MGCTFSHSDFVNLGQLFSWWVCLKIYQFCSSFQKTCCYFHWSFFLFFKNFYFISFFSDLHYFFPSTNFALFWCRLFWLVWWKVRLFEIFLLSWCGLVLLWTSLLELLFAASHGFWICFLAFVFSTYLKKFLLWLYQWCIACLVEYCLASTSVLFYFSLKCNHIESIGLFWHHTNDKFACCTTEYCPRKCYWTRSRMLWYWI